ncbi:helix-turn-helix domain-containing protein [Bythopirellula goksoeyrii]|uniref:helix-turn-helix domain-containing protein n=1 Tax=Bythopirellula goksoeyrii TaxID=1400387 RepID=UPI0011CE370B
MNSQLSPRQFEVVRLTSLGCLVTEIAAILGISRIAVTHHQAAAMEKLGTDRVCLAHEVRYQT